MTMNTRTSLVPKGRIHFTSNKNRSSGISPSLQISHEPEGHRRTQPRSSNRCRLELQSHSPTAPC